ncbi:nucleoside-diphosphate kinase [Kitasatospora sp. LaBMicrA B282]|uniref:nucleoside-diphosphate kinase n=1 Tax=Kitasatospora sp. LaBMicrA B282 TaxID=3420949 RepID=UPI003D119079
MTGLDYRRTALLLVTPDAIRRRLGGEIVGRVRSAGFRITGHRLWPTAPADLDAFHRRNEPVARDPALYRLVAELFALGPLLALAVQSGPDLPPEDVHRLLARLKGRGDPAYAAAGSIRKDLGSINTILNIVHSSDDAADSAREGALFLEDGPGPLESGAAALERALHIAQQAQPHEPRIYEDVLGSVRSRILTALWPQLSPARRERAGDWCARAGLRGLGRPAGGDLLAGLLPAGHGLDGFLAAPAAGEPPRPLEPAALAELGVVLDPWEHLVLATSRYYPPLPAAPDPTAPAGAASTEPARPLEPAQI